MNVFIRASDLAGAFDPTLVNIPISGICEHCMGSVTLFYINRPVIFIHCFVQKRNS